MPDLPAPDAAPAPASAPPTPNTSALDATAPESLDAMTFEALLTRLDGLAATLDDPSLGLDDAVARYEAAAEIARHALDRLRRAEARVQHLSLQ